MSRIEDEIIKKCIRGEDTLDDTCSKYSEEMSDNDIDHFIERHISTDIIHC